MVVTNDDTLNDKLRILRDHGMNPTRRYWHDVVGYNYRMTNMQAALGVAQMERWKQILAAKDFIQSRYDSHIDFSQFEIAKTLPDSRPVCWLYTLLLKNDNGQTERDALMEHLKSLNIDSRPFFYPVPAMPPYYSENWRQKFPVALWLAERGFSLPSSVDLDEKTQYRIAECLNEYGATVLKCR
jgi:perosamine synthetase